MIVLIQNLAISGNAEDLSLALIAFYESNTTISRVKRKEFEINGTTYIGEYNNFANDKLNYTIISPIAQSASGNFKDHEVYWGLDAEGTSVFVIVTVDESGNQSVQYLDQPGGSDISQSITLPVKPSSFVNSVTFDQVGVGVLDLTDTQVKSLADCVNPTDDQDVTGIPSGATGAICIWVSDGEALVTTSGLPIADGSNGIPLKDGDIFSPGANPDVVAGDASQLSSSRFIAATGSTGRFEVVFYKKNA